MISQPSPLPSPPSPRFPIDAALPRLFDALRERGGAVLQAPAGAGKTLRVPTALLEQPWLPGHHVVVVQPNGLAARAAAVRMAALLGEEVGCTVGFRTLTGGVTGPRMRIELLPAALFLRRIQDSPELADVGAVLFDSVHGDGAGQSPDGWLALAFAREAREALCGGTLLLTMSEPADAAPVAALLGGAEAPVPLVTGGSPGFPVEIRLLDGPAPAGTDAVADAVGRALREERGGILAFLPDDDAVRRAAALLEPVYATEILPIPLGDEPFPELLDAALAPAPPGRRKLVLATPLAEAGLGIADIRIVVDCGLTRAAPYDSRRAMGRPAVLPAGADAAARRAAVAGRTEPGICYRLPPEAVPCPPPESLRADPEPPALELAAWGVKDPAAFPLPSLPPAADLAGAMTLLVRLGAVGADGAITRLGERMARLGLHPRLSRLILGGAEIGLGGLACTVAALLEEGGPPDGSGEPELWIGRLLDVERGAFGALDPEWAESGEDWPGGDWRRWAWRVLARAQLWRGRIGIHQPVDGTGLDRVGDLLALAYPDRAARPDSPAPDGPSGDRQAIPAAASPEPDPQRDVRP